MVSAKPLHGPSAKTSVCSCTEATYVTEVPRAGSQAFWESAGKERLGKATGWGKAAAVRGRGELRCEGG